MNNEIVEELVRQIAALEKRLEYMETVEKNVFSTVTASGNITSTGDIYCTLGQFYSYEIASIANDAVTSFYPSSGIGLLVVGGRNSNYDECSGIIAYRCAATTFTNIVCQTSTLIEVTTGILEGAGGNDLKVTISAHTDGKIYISNRTGYTISLSITLLGT